jgi:hypothetical protein
MLYTTFAKEKDISHYAEAVADIHRHHFMFSGRMTLTPEELAEYGIGTTPNLSMKDLYAELHNSWILVMHNEYCILDWMFSHRKA